MFKSNLSHITTAVVATAVGIALTTPVLGQTASSSQSNFSANNVQTEHQSGLAYQTNWVPTDNLQPVGAPQSDGAPIENLDGLDADGSATAELNQLNVGEANPSDAISQVDSQPEVVEALNHVRFIEQQLATFTKELDDRNRRYQVAQSHVQRLMTELDGKPEEIRSAAKLIDDVAEQKKSLVRMAYMSPLARKTVQIPRVDEEIADVLRSGESVNQALERTERKLKDLGRAAELEKQNFSLASTTAHAAVAELDKLELETRQLNESLSRAQTELGQARMNLEEARRAASERLEEEARLAAEARRASLLASFHGSGNGEAVVSPLPENADLLAAGWDLWRMATLDGRQQVMTCPVAHPVSFIDSWGFPRSGGRTHKGVDMMAAKGTPLYAVADGRVERAYWNRLGGLSVNYYDSLGHKYYYAHLDSVYVTDGQELKVGQLLGTVGNTGNAMSTPPHLHWQFHPNGGAPVNPYELARALCGPNS